MNVERFLEQVIWTLSTSPDFSTTIDNLARLGTDELADWCGIYTFEHEQTVRRVAVSPASQTEVLFPLDLHATAGPAHIRRTGEVQVLNNPDLKVAEQLGLKAEEFVLPGGRKPSTCACVPAMARERMIGAVVFMCGHPKATFNQAKLSLAMSLANAAAVAIDNSRLFREAQEANRLKDEFVAMVSHELRTPLTPILGCIHLLRTARLNEATLERVLEMMERNAHAQVQIVEVLLDASRIVAGKLHLIRKSTQVLPVVEAAIDTLQASADAKGIRVSKNFTEVDSVDGDPHRLQQIVWNLLSNAVKFTPPGGRIEVSVRSEGDHVQVQVTDNGVGIPADILPHIFDRFRRGAGSGDGSKMRSGLGLGLAIVRHLVELHNGSIDASSAGPGQGAVFTIRFPVAVRRTAAATAGSER